LPPFEETGSRGGEKSSCVSNRVIILQTGQEILLSIRVHEFSFTRGGGGGGVGGQKPRRGNQSYLARDAGCNLRSPGGGVLWGEKGENFRRRGSEFEGGKGLEGRILQGRSENVEE